MVIGRIGSPGLTAAPPVAEGYRHDGERAVIRPHKMAAVRASVLSQRDGNVPRGYAQVSIQSRFGDFEFWD